MNCLSRYKPKNPICKQCAEKEDCRDIKADFEHQKEMVHQERLCYPLFYPKEQSENSKPEQFNRYA